MGEAGARTHTRGASAEVLGADHPLTRAVDAREVVTRQARVVGMLLCVAAALAVAGAAGAASLTAGAGAVELGLLAAAAQLAVRARGHALTLIEHGDELLPVPAVRRAREDLLGDRRRAELAAAFEQIAESSAPPRPPTRVQPLHRPRTIRAVAPDLLDVAALLRDGPGRARGVARAHRLLTDGASPLYRDDAAALRWELRRIRLLLTGC